MKLKIEKKCFVSEIIASELVSLNCVFKNRIPFVGSQCVSKNNEDLACHLKRPFPTQLTWQ